MPITSLDVQLSTEDLFSQWDLWLFERFYALMQFDKRIVPQFFDVVFSQDTVLRPFGLLRQKTSHLNVQSTKLSFHGIRQINRKSWEYFSQGSSVKQSCKRWYLTVENNSTLVVGVWGWRNRLETCDIKLKKLNDASMEFLIHLRKKTRTNWGAKIKRRLLAHPSKYATQEK